MPYLMTDPGTNNLIYYAPQGDSWLPGIYDPIRNAYGGISGWQLRGATSAPALSTPSSVAASTGTNPLETQYSLYGHIVPLSVFGVGRIGGEIISGPWVDNGRASFIISFGVPADPSGTRTLRQIAFDSEVVWENGVFVTEAFTFRFYGGTLSQSADSLETSHFGSDAVAYRPQILLAFDNLPLANTKFGKIPYVAAVIADATGDDVNLGEAFERVAYSPWVGYTSAQFETSGITDGLVSGGLIFSDNSDFLSTIQQFARFYPTWDILQTDKLRIVDRGDSVDADITLDGSRLIGNVVVNRRGPDSIPGVLELSTIDPDADYTILPSRAQRPRNPVAVTTSVETDTAYLPAIMDASTRAAVVTLAKYHEEQIAKTVSGTVMAYGLEIEPGAQIALVNLTEDFNGEVFKVFETLHGANHVVEFTAAAILRCTATVEPPAEPPPSDWTETFAPTMISNQGGWGGVNQRQLLNASLLSTSGAQVRVTFSSATDAGLSIDKVYIGHQASSGDPYDFDGGQVQLFFTSSAGVSISANASVVSDAATFALDETKNLIIAIHYTGTSNVRCAAPSGASNYYKNGADDAATTNATGYSFDGTFTCRCVSKIEVHA